MSEITDAAQPDAEPAEARRFATSVIDGLSAHICVLDEQGVIIAVNQAWRDFSQLNGGTPAQVFEGSNYLSVCARAVHGQSPEISLFHTRLQEVLKGVRQHFELEYPCHAPHERRWFVVRVSRIRNSTPARIVVAHDNVTAVKLAHEAALASEHSYRTLYETVPQGVVYQNTQGHITDANPAAQRILGVTLSQMQGLTSMDPRWHAIREDNSPFPGSEHPAMQALRTRQSVRNVIMGINAPERGTVWIRVDATPLFKDGELTEVYTSFDDITDMRKAAERQRLASSVFSHAREGITITDTDARIIDVNEAFTRITGYERSEVIGQNPRLLRSGRQDPRFYQALWKDLLERGFWNGEIWNRRKNGEIYPELLSISAVKDGSGRVMQYVGLFSDITVRKQLEEQIAQMAFHDALTQLPNRRLLYDRLGQTQTASRRGAYHGALIFLDLDNFKSLNDDHGHSAGDLLLIEVAARLRACVRETDTVARFGGDEFVVMLSELHADAAQSGTQALSVAEKIRTSLAEPCQVEVQRADQSPRMLEYRCHASIGVTLFAGDTDSADAVVRQADAAMYRAKAQGRNTVCLHPAP